MISIASRKKLMMRSNSPSRRRKRLLNRCPMICLPMFMRANHRARSGPRAREWGACAIALRFGITRDDENLSRKDRTNFVPKGLKDSAWGFNPRCPLEGPPRPEGAAEPVPQICQDLPNEPLTTNIFRPFSIPNPLRGCNSGKALLIGLTRLFSKQQRTSTRTNAERRTRSAL